MSPGPNAGGSPPSITTTTTTTTTVGTAPTERGDSSFRDVSRSPSPLPALKHQWRGRGGPSIELHATGGRPTTLRNHFPGKRAWANVRLLLRVGSLLCSVVTGLLVGAVIATWKHTRSERWMDEMLWPKNPQLVPTYYMISASVITIVAHLGLIIAHCGSKERYLTEAYTKRDRISSIIQLFLGLTWVAGGILARVYTYDKYGDGNDLWTWSCTSAWHSQGEGHEGPAGISWMTVCAWLRAAYCIAYVNATLEFLSIFTFSINTCLARRGGYTAPGMH